MKSEQRIVAMGAGSGAVLMVVSVWLLTFLLPTPTIPDDIAARLAYALGANVLAIVPFFIMLATISNERFFSSAIDPTRHAEGTKMEIDGRVADNTLQQNFVFLAATLALSTVVPFQSLQVIWACAVVFVVARAAFWLGYRIHPLYRAPGMAATSRYLPLKLLAKPERIAHISVSVAPYEHGDQTGHIRGAHCVVA